MSGIEGFAIAGVAANLLQLIDYSMKVYDRLEQYHTSANGLPEAFLHVKTRLGVLLDVLRTVNNAMDIGALPDSSKAALRPVVDECQVQVNELGSIMRKALPRPEMNGLQRNWKAIRSLKYDRRLERITKVIKGYESSLTMHASISKYQDLSARPRPQPSSNVPFRRDPNYVERQRLTTQIKDKSQKSASRVALVGIGGVGKSQLAVEYSYNVRDSSPDTWVFWVHAGSTADIEKGFASIADKAQIHAWNAADSKRFQVVSNWLADEANGKWLIIIDNADDLSVFLPEQEQSPGNKKASKSNNTFAASTRDLLSLFPESPNSSYLITSRNKSVAYRLTGDHNDIIDVEPMQEDESITLLRKKTRGDIVDEDAADLVAALDYMPLAVTQASAYINENTPRVTVKKYLEKLKEGDDDRAKLLEESVYDARRDGKRSNSIIATWQISFESIRSYRPSAARLLSLMSLFDRNGIPESLLSGRYEAPIEQSPPAGWWRRRKAKRQKKEKIEQEKKSLDFDEDWRVLSRFSLIATEIDGSHFGMHRLVQFSTKKWLDMHGELQFWMTNFIKLMYDRYPRDIKAKNALSMCERLSLHAQAAMACKPSSSDPDTMQQWALLLHSMGVFTHFQCFSEHASYMFEGALKVLTAVLGEDHHRTLETLEWLAVTLESIKEFDKAESSFRRVLAGKRKLLGEEHAQTLETCDKLVAILYKQKKFEEGDTMHRDVMKTRERLFGGEDGDNHGPMERHAYDLFCHGRNKEAVAIWRHTLSLRGKINGDGFDPKWANNMDHYGLRLLVGGNPKEAEIVHREIFEYKERTLGLEHPQTLSSVNHLASALFAQENFVEAEKYFRISVNGQLELNGRDNKDTLGPMEHLAWTLLQNKKLAEADVLSKELLAGRKTLDDDPHGTAFAFNIVANVLQQRQRVREALPYFEKAYMINKSAYGEDSVDTRDYLQHWATAKEEAEKLRGKSSEVYIVHEFRASLILF